MKVKLEVNHTKELKKMSYRILRRMHDLEKGRRVAQVYSKLCRADACVLACLIHLSDLLQKSITPVGSSEASAVTTRYLLLLNQLIEEVRRGAATNTRLNSRTLGYLLNTHTTLFNVLLRKKVKIPVNPQSWGNVVLPAIAVWGNRI
jgi:hypothetical protein